MTGKPVWQLSATGDAVLAWPDDLPAVADVTKFSIELDADTLTTMLNTLRAEQLGADSKGDL